MSAEPLESVLTRMNFLADGEDNPRAYLYEPKDGSPPRTAITKHEVRIHDCRAVMDALSLDGEGFAFRRHDSAIRNFYDPAEVERVYYPEVADLVREVTGATRVHVFDHNVRNAAKAAQGEDGAHKPVQYVHNDYTENSGPQRVRDLLAPDDAARMLRHRFSVINVWRPIRGPVADKPLAVCDAATMGSGDFVSTDLVYEDRLGEVYSVRHSPRQRWYFLSDMAANEVLFLKCYDS